MKRALPLVVFVLASAVAPIVAPIARAEPTTYTLTSGEVGFEIEAPLDVIGAVSRGVTGSVTLDPKAWTTAPQAKIDIDLTTFRTGIDLRDEDLRDQFFETSKFTKATLTLTGLERASSPALTEGTVNEAIAVGTLSLHGVDKPVRIPLKVAPDPGGQRVVVTGEFVLPFLQHGIQRPKRLIFKLGTDVKVNVRAVFRAKAPASAPAVALSAEEKAASGPPPPPVVARPVVEKPKPKWQFADTTPEGRGERAFVTSKIGGDKNALSCKSCHSLSDERKGQFEQPGNIVKPASTMWNAAGRATLWQGLAPTPGRAADICARLFMRRPDGLDAKVQGDIDAYIKKLSTDAQPPLDYDVIHLSRRAPLMADVDKGDRARGKKLTDTYCKSCHQKGAVRPDLEPGLYEAEMIVARVRRAPGSDNQQMPLFTVTKLPDSELRDIVSYLVGDEKTRIFKRKKREAIEAKNAAAAPKP
jgi:polyisoprenoid-binding protein YceI/mono/diheme cytochrome c family protein